MTEIHKTMIKLFFLLIRLGFLALVLALFFHNWTARTILSKALEFQLAVPVEVESARVDFLRREIIFRNLRIRNSGEFPQGHIIKLSYLLLVLDCEAVFDGRLGFKRIEADVSDFQIMKNKRGEFNWQALKFVRQPPLDNFEGNKKIPIERFRLSIRRGTYVELGRRDLPQMIPMNLENREYLGVRSVDDAVKLISYEALKAMGLLAVGGEVLDQMREDLDSGPQRASRFFVR